MDAAPIIVSLWKSNNGQGFLCSGLLLTGRHILTVKHAFDELPDPKSVFVRLLPGVDQFASAKLMRQHPDRDAALLVLEAPVEEQPFPHLLREAAKSYDGRPATLRVIDPDSHNRSNPSNYSIGNYDHATGEYVVSPENAIGHSGGVVEVDGQLIALLCRRTKGDPLCRGLSMPLLWPWIESAICRADTSPLPSSTPADLNEAGESGRSKPPLGDEEQARLRKIAEQLTKLFENDELREITKVFTAILVKTNPNLGDNPRQIAEYLACESNAEKRYQHLADFLTILDRMKSRYASSQVLKKFLGYLLQTLIRKCVDGGQQGYSRVPLKYPPTTELLAAFRLGAPHVPDCSEANISNQQRTEHRNGRKNKEYQHVGMFTPPSGEWEPEKECEKIAGQLLVECFGYSPDNVSDSDRLKLLTGELRAHFSSSIIEPEELPLKGIFIYHDDKNSPLRVPEIVKRLREILGNMVWIYEFGELFEPPSNWLLVEQEEDIIALIRRYERIQSTAPEQPK